MARNSGRPKNPYSSFVFWLKENRDRLRMAGHRTPGEMMTAAGIEFRLLEDKSKWKKLARDDKIRYVHEMEDYKNKIGENVADKVIKELETKVRQKDEHLAKLQDQIGDKLMVAAILNQGKNYRIKELVKELRQKDKHIEKLQDAINKYWQ